MRKIIAAIGAALTAVALLHAAGNATAVPKAGADCDRVASADKRLCLSVSTYHPYGAWYGTPEAYWSVPSGKANVRELTHSGLTKAEMHMALVGYAAEYREWVTAVPVNMDAMVKKCGNTDGRWIVSYHDEDGRPGGLKLTYARIVCA